LQEALDALKDPVRLQRFAEFLVAWTRIQGGEPLLDEKKALATALLSRAALQWMLRQEGIGNPRMVIQTNGLFLGQCSNKFLVKLVSSFRETLSNLETGRLAIEISFKGANPKTAQRYGASIPLETDVLKTQILGFSRFLDTIADKVWRTGEMKLAAYPVAGIGPTLFDPSLIPVDVEHPNLPIFHSKTWSEDFSEQVINRFRQTLMDNPLVYRDFVQVHKTRIPIESMEPTKFQFGRTSQISKRPELKAYVQAFLRISKRGRLGLYGSSIKCIPDAERQLLPRVAELGADFYEAEPSTHYPYL
jgi:hypothetical protein